MDILSTTGTPHIRLSRCVIGHIVMCDTFSLGGPQLTDLLSYCLFKAELHHRSDRLAVGCFLNGQI
jgi:hypothetical protein